MEGKYSVLMHENGEMRSVETTQEWGEGQ
jgi:hypothetical protein